MSVSVWGVCVCVGVCVWVCVGVCGGDMGSCQYWGRAPTFGGSSAYQRNRGNGSLCVSLQIIVVTVTVSITLKLIKYYLEGSGAH